MLLAESGLSECATDARCSADLDRELLEWLLSMAAFGAFCLLWIGIGVVTTSVATVDDLSRRRFVVAVAAAWLVPILGAVVLYRMKKFDRDRIRGLTAAGTRSGDGR
ncbi:MULTISPECIES: hypothetical protein [Nocardiaceae]|uniref:Cardiolipin synthase N-terminal domain-containing protein n=1 Tax=Rhodococcoides corynebacterioides TaxID=53972 RepID=A0ABS2KUC2_9NOCA|nr:MULTISPECIES: hypothetical protein [Rhodococcus]MBM7415544.1 hypothetical protein [Rhodococcus corynebacterioides]MBP1118006.1 hypothetical protein [Rhodococcus sp. PvP016]